MNELNNESSAYLKQHVENPVHWKPYKKEIIQKAEEDGKPIFLSIGYSSCHWCHVMAHESFEDQTTADYLNENFVNIKVDREEFPDLDQMFQKAAMFYGRNGGWPLSVFLTADMKPFFVGTYFPKSPRVQPGTQPGTDKPNIMPSFMDVLKELKGAYDRDPNLISQNAERAMEFIRDPNPGEEQPRIELSGHFPNPNSIFDALKEYLDDDNGGFGGAPKFPMFAFWEWASEQMAEGIVSREHGEFVVKTIDSILCGGMYDQARGGVHRYSTDKEWIVPHFEKMLYDQAGLLKALSKASLLYPAPHVIDGIAQTLEYIKMEMQSDSGYFFSAQDADSEGQEGLYFTYTYDELNEIIENNESLKSQKEKLTSYFPFTPEGNFENGLNIITFNLTKKKDFLEIENWTLVREFKKALLEDRKTRIPPMTDNKGIASWNFFLVSALVDVIQFVRVPSIKNSAKNLLESAMKGIHENFIKDGDGTTLSKIRHTTTKNESLHYLEDYAFFADMQIRLFELTGEEIFKNNFNTTLEFIFNEFFKDDNLFSRSLTQNDLEPYPNLPVERFDLSFRSPFSVVINITRRHQVLFSTSKFVDKLNKLIDDFKQRTLRNPLNHAMGLRALCYPDQAYRVLKCPKDWAGKGEFIDLWCQLLYRFTISYEAERNEKQSWEICTTNSCDLNGETLEDLIQKIKPPKEPT